MNVKTEILDIIQSAVREALYDEMNDFAELPGVKIEYPREEKFGDYASPFALEAAKVLKRSPMDIGNKIKEFIEKSSMVEKVEIVKPGYSNIFLSLEFLWNNMQTILSEKNEYGKLKKENPKKINIEFVSANPTGPLNIVSARAAALGDTIANLLEANGDIVEREYYVNDYGNQVELLGLSVLCRYRELEGKKVEFPENGYHGDYIKEIALYIKGNYEEKISSINNDEELVTYMTGLAVQYNVEGQKKDMETFNIKYRTWFHEKDLHSHGKVRDVLAFLESRGVIYEEDGKKLFKSTDFGDDKDRVVVRDDGRPTYLLADIAYHKEKIERKYDTIIDIWGPDHHGYIARLSGAMEAMGFQKENFIVLIAQQVNLIMQGEMVKMSKRLGNFSTMSELIEEIGVDVARYFFIMRSIESHLDFDLSLAKKHSTENPVFYLQYAHARICSIFSEAKKRGIKYKPEETEYKQLDSKEAIALLKLMAMFSEEISDAAQSIEPHRIPVYLMKLAQCFHRFYTEHRVISEDTIRTNAFLALSDCVRIVMKNGLYLLGVSAPERM